ncbi:MAG: response regulator, partial [Flavobacterium sp.]
LAISKKIIALLGGELYLRSSSEKGSCFEIKLPLAFAEQKEVLQPIVTNYEPSPQNKTIIVVDDDPDLLQLTTEVLKQYYNVISFSNADEALQNLDSQKFDLLITDIQMPNKDGFELIKELQNNENYSKQPLLAVTGRADLDHSVYTNAGFTTVLKKPFTPSILLKTIDAILNKNTLPIQANEVQKSKKEDELFSLDSLKIFLKDDNEAIKTVLESFISSTNSNLILLENSIQSEEHQKTQQLAHRMAPMFKQIEATEIAVILDKLELERHNETELAEHLSHLKSKIIVLFKELEKNI